MRGAAAAVVAACCAQRAAGQPPAPLPLPPPGAGACATAAKGGALAELCDLLALNFKTYDITYGGDDRPYANHLPYRLATVYRLGGGVADLRARWAAGAKCGMYPPSPVNHDVNASSWAELRGRRMGCEDLLTCPDVHIDFPDYARFFRGEVARLGADKAARQYLPGLVRGAAADMLHGLILLGYYFESGVPDLLPDGMAWVASAYVELEPAWPDARRRGGGGWTSPAAALDALRADAARPLFGGGVDFFARLRTLTAADPPLLANYSLAVPDDAGAAADLAMEVAAALADRFCPGFFMVHTITSARAAWQLVRSGLLDAAGRREVILAVWRAALYIYTAEGTPRAGGWGPAAPQPWAAVLEQALHPACDVAQCADDAHVAKLVLFGSDFDRRRPSPAWRRVASGAVSLFRGGGGWSFTGCPTGENGTA